jgi:hypothetical protein
MTKPHEWAKEIKAWADGAEIEQADIRENANPRWYEADNPPNWETTFYKYRIKPQPKKPQYLYVWKDNLHEIKLTTNAPHPLKEYVSINWKCIGKIKLENDDE